jgi:hypothetical protein
MILPRAFPCCRAHDQSVLRRLETPESDPEAVMTRCVPLDPFCPIPAIAEAQPQRPCRVESKVFADTLVILLGQTGIPALRNPSRNLCRSFTRAKGRLRRGSLTVKEGIRNNN